MSMSAAALELASTTKRSAHVRNAGRAKRKPLYIYIILILILIFFIKVNDEDNFSILLFLFLSISLMMVHYRINMDPISFQHMDICFFAIYPVIKKKE